MAAGAKSSRKPSVSALLDGVPGPRDAIGPMLEGFRENRLLTYASAIAFQVLSGLIPLILFLLGLLGFLHLTEVWSQDIAPDIRDEVSRAAFTVIDDTVRRVLGSKQLFWLTGGAALALWSTSGAMRAVMDALDEVYRVERRRKLRDRLAVSFALTVVLGGCFLGALAVVRFTPLLWGHLAAPLAVLLFLARWSVAVALLILGIGLMLRYAPSERQDLRWVSFGSVTSTAAWVAMSLVFGWYLTSVADYGSLFANLATVFVLMTYLYLAACFLLGGIQLDAVVRSRVQGGADAPG